MSTMLITYNCYSFVFEEALKKLGTPVVLHERWLGYSNPIDIADEARKLAWEVRARNITDVCLVHTPNNATIPLFTEFMRISAIDYLYIPQFSMKTDFAQHLIGFYRYSTTRLGNLFMDNVLLEQETHNAKDCQQDL